MNLNDTCNTIAQRAPGIQPRIAVVLGSGLGGLTAHLSDAVQIPYTDLPGFPQPGVAGHSATLWLGRLGRQAVAVMTGKKPSNRKWVADPRTPSNGLTETGIPILILRWLWHLL